MSWLETAASRVDHLEGVVIAQLPDCVPWNDWSRIGWDATEVAAYFGDMTRANRNALKTVSADGEDTRLTIESGGKLILTKDLSQEFVAIFLFRSELPLGMARLRVKQLAKAIIEQLPSGEVVERAHGERVMEFLLRYAPDAHAIPMRVALQTGIPMALLRTPAKLDAAQVSRLEEAAKAILGLQTLRI